jgi:hypothetical protein
MYIVRFSFPLPEGLYPNDGIFLGQILATSKGALPCALLPQFRLSAIWRVAHRLFERSCPLPRLLFPGWREEKAIPTTRTSGALSPRRWERINHLNWVRIITSLFPLPD